MKQGTIKFDRNVKVLGESAFEGLSTLTSITIPKSVQIIENNAFKGCSNIEKIIYKGTSDNWYNISIEEFYDTSIAGKIVSCIDDDIIIPNYLTFTALEDGEIGFYVNPDASIQPTIEYSYDKQNWNTLTEEYVSVPSGSNLYCRGINPFGISTEFDEGNCNYFIGTGQFNISGDIMSLIDYKHSVKEMIGTMMYMFGRDDGDYVDIVDASNLILSAETLISDCYQNMFDSCANMVYPPQIRATALAPYCYRAMFYNCSSLEYAPELPVTTLAEKCYEVMFYNCSSLATAPKLPATTLAKGCYEGMFLNCTSLTTAPELSAIELAYGCYMNMFHSCKSLTTAPELPATELADWCYQTMFRNCTSLTTAPELPATTLAKGCYNSMFAGCTSLTTAPELPTATLAEGCYLSMFQGCSSLNHIKCLATDISATNCTKNWVDGVASTGTFIKHPDMNGWVVDSVSGIPTGWTVEDCIDYLTFTAEEAGSTLGLKQLSTNQTLKYSYDKSTWSNMDTSTIITLANVDDEVYIKGVLSADNTSSDYTQFKMTGKIAVSGNCNAIWNYQDLEAPLKSYCGRHMFSGCRSLTTAPELPAIILADHCYQSMFEGCSSLTTAPELPATTLDSSCYSTIFSNCISLVTAPELPATTLANNCYAHMFWGCSSLVTAPELPATTLADWCYGKMFYNCTSLTAAPVLPATELAGSCYYQMFYNCINLTTAPELPATMLVNFCYTNMFGNCTNLNHIKCLATDISAIDCTANWVERVASTGTFIKHPDMNDWVVDSANGIPTGWTVEDNRDVNYLCFEPLEDNNQLSVIKTVDWCNAQYSFDKKTWTEFPIDGSNPLNPVFVTVDRPIYLKGNNPNGYINVDAMEGSKIVGLGKYNISGDVTTLLNEVGNVTNLTGCYGSCFSYLFGEMDLTSTLGVSIPAIDVVDASKLILPSTALTDYCYAYMFLGCSSLTAAPELPAIALAEYCYLGMFRDCTNLTTAPELPATTLINDCYEYMFDNCSSLTTAPELPATELADWCYTGMFYNCTSLVTAPELPATTLADYCYLSMFEECNSLNEIKCLATDISAYSCTANWVNGVAETGTFIKNPDMNDWVIDSVDGIPTGWTVINNGETPTPTPGNPEEPENPETTAYVTFKAEEANSTIGLVSLSTNQTLEYSTDATTWVPMDTSTTVTLPNIDDEVYVRGVLSDDNAIYNYTQFKMTGKIAASGNCNAIWNYQDLNTPLKGLCGYYMFLDCTSLTIAPELPAMEVASSGCYHGMFQGCTSLTIAPELPAMEVLGSSYKYMFQGCTSLTTAPELPATKIENQCYNSMFDGCTNLTTAPSVLPATELYKSCYNSMFDGCTNLTTAPELPAATLADSCYQSMFNGCSSLNYIKCLATDISATNCTFTWTQGVSSIGTFIKHPDMNDWKTGVLGVDGIPRGWTVEDVYIPGTDVGDEFE